MGAAPMTFCLKGKCSTVELQTPTKKGTDLSPIIFHAIS